MGTVEAILEATAQVLIRDGYEALSTNRVAERAGVSVGSLYQYFPNKAALLVALIDRHVAETEALVTRALAELFDAPLAVAVPRMVELMIELHQHDPKLHQALFGQLPGAAYLPTKARLEEKITLLIEAYLLQRGVPASQVELLAFLAVTTVESATHAAVIQRPEHLQDPAFERSVSGMVLSLFTDAKPRRSAATKP